MLKTIAKIVGAKLENEIIPAELCHTKETKTKYARLPALFLAGDIVIYETTAIARYLARNSPLYKGTEEHMAQIDSWMELIKYEVLEKAYPDVIFAILGHKEYTQKSYNEALAAFKSFIPRLNKIEGFIVGSSLTIADLFGAAMLHLPFALVLDEGLRKTFSKVAAWFTKVANEPAFVEFFGLPRFCKTTLKPFLPPKEEQAVEEKGKKDAKPKAKKEDKPKGEAKTEEAEDDGMEDDDKPKKKPPNPLDLLKPSSLNIDDFKREFLANKTPESRRDYMKTQFWSKFDPEGWALWLSEYDKAEGEGQVLYMTSNLLNGFLAVSS
jgi:elongation factor 1-gamma